MSSLGLGSVRNMCKGLLLAAVATATVWMSTGCGLGTMASATNDPATPFAVGGRAMGGYVPIVGGTATLWKTANNGTATTGLAGGYYAGTATALQTVTTDSNGGFNFTAANGCSTSAPDEYYITIQGGNSGGTQSNPNILLLAAVGNCTQLLATSFVDVDEVTTVAAAYALAGFTTVSSSTTGGVTTNAVNITSSSTNYAATSSSVGTIYHPVGLQHAFLNAYNLADVTQGAARTTHPTNAAAVMPAPLLNSIANVLQDCTNSNGATPEISFTTTAPSGPTGGILTSNALSSGTDTISGALTVAFNGGSPVTFGPFTNATTSLVTATITGNSNVATATFNGSNQLVIQAISGTTIAVAVTDAQFTGSGAASMLLDVPATPNTCGAILAAALPLSTGTPSAPTNILQAALNIATNPYMGGAGKAATYLGLSTGTGTNPFTPVLSPSGAGTVAALPRDLSAAITYPSTQWSTAATYNSASTLDANDQFYVASEWGGAAAYYYFEMSSMSSNGTIQYTHTYSNNSTYVSGAEQVGAVGRLQADALGDLWMINTGTTTVTATYATTQSGLIEVNAANGAFSGPGSTSTQTSEYALPSSSFYAYSIAIDQNNDVFVGQGTSGTSYNVFKFPNASGTPTTSFTMGTAASTGITLNKYAYQMIFDANQNLIVADYNTTASTNYVAMLPNLNLNSNTYPQSSANAALSPTPALASTSVTLNTAGSYDYGVAVDASGNIYQESGTTSSAGGLNDGMWVLQPNYTVQGSGTYAGKYAVSSYTSLTSSLIAGAAMSTSNGLFNVQFSRPSLMTEDGSGAVWSADIYNDTVIRLYGTAGTSVLSFQPCIGSYCVLLPATGQTSGTASHGGLYGSREAYADSTGALWVMGTSVGTNVGGNITQIFGVAAPSYPLLQAGHPAQMP